VPLTGHGEPAADVVGGGGGGCSIARVSDDDTLDPTLPVLAALAALILGLRRRRPPTPRRSVRHEP
jgi:MYXO-CTERM domain-containing protein